MARYAQGVDVRRSTDSYVGHSSPCHETHRQFTLQRYTLSALRMCPARICCVVSVVSYQGFQECEDYGLMTTVNMVSDGIWSPVNFPKNYDMTR